ncbi:MAG: adenylate kinase [Endozoicomonadaceae bacterium]|nr:adenylate kinase [Endozoicomonadaceae bacterium]
MRIILMGPPGSGKGTQADLLSTHFDILKISTGDILRKATYSKTTLGLEVQSMMDTGRLVPDSLIIQLVKTTLQISQCKKGFLLDGFPRTIEQATALKESKIDVDYVIELQLSDDLIIERLSGRRVHLQSGRTYHTVYHPPRQENIDDMTGESLVQREDDQQETIQKRLAIYHQYTHPVTEFYSTDYQVDQKIRYCVISGLGSAQEVFGRILKTLSK